MIAEVRLGDWRDVLPGTYDPARAVVVTDPPFGLDADKGYVDTTPWSEHVTQVLDQLPARRHVIRGSAPLLVARDHPQPRRLCIEASMYRRRAARRPGVVPYLWHAWAVYGRLLIGRRRLPPLGDVVIIRPFENIVGRPKSGPREHRGLTPYGSAYWAVETWADAGWTVLDPFAGLATIGQAAGALGLDYIGAEIDPAWAAEGSRALTVAAPRLAL
jgi:hypothetical protein